MMDRWNMYGSWISDDKSKKRKIMYDGNVKISYDKNLNCCVLIRV